MSRVVIFLGFKVGVTSHPPSSSSESVLIASYEVRARVRVRVSVRVSVRASVMVGARVGVMVSFRCRCEA